MDTCDATESKYDDVRLSVVIQLLDSAHSHLLLPFYLLSHSVSPSRWAICIAHLFHLLLTGLLLYCRQTLLRSAFDFCWDVFAEIVSESKHQNFIQTWGWEILILGQSPTMQDKANAQEHVNSQTEHLINCVATPWQQSTTFVDHFAWAPLKCSFSYSDLSHLWKYIRLLRLSNNCDHFSYLIYISQFDLIFSSFP